MKSEYLIIPVLCFLTMAACQRQEARRKIRLSDEQTVTTREDQLTTTIHLTPAERRSIAVMFFENLTGDQNLEWLRQGLTEMFIRALSQSQSLSVVSMERMIDIINRLESGSERLDMDIAAVMAREANVETVLTGNISRNGDSLMINVKVHEPDQGLVLKEEAVEGAGLESIFGMVDRLTASLKTDLALSSENDKTGRSLTELSTNSLEAWRHYTRGVEQGSQYLFGPAIESYRKAVELDSTFIDAWIGLAQMTSSAGIIQESRALFEKLETMKPMATERQLRQIELWVAMSRNDFFAIMDAADKWLAFDPQDLMANKFIANLQYNTGRPEVAIPYYRKVLELDPHDRDSYNMLGYCYGEMGELEKSEMIFKKYEEIAPDEPNPFDSMGEVFMMHGKYGEAEKYFKKAYKVNNKFTAAQVHLGMLYLDQGKTGKAVKAFQKAHDEALNDTEKLNALLYRGLSFWRAGEHETAISSIDEAIALVNAPYNLALRKYDIYSETGDSTSARETIETAYKNLIKIEEPSFNILTFLAILSLNHNINVDQTIDHLFAHADKADTQLNRINLNFFISILYLRSERPFDSRITESDALLGLNEDFARQFVQTMKSVPAMNYSDQGQFFEIQHTLVTQNAEPMKQQYRKLVDLLLEESITGPAMLFTGLLADLHQRWGDAESAAVEYQRAGFPDERLWKLIGPFDYKNGFTRSFPPEKRIDLNAEYDGKYGKIGWGSAEDPVNEGFINLNARFGSPTWAVGYGLIEIHSEIMQKAQLRIGCDDNVRVWLNGEEVWKYHFRNKAKASFDGFSINVVLNKGVNRILVKVGNWYADWGYYFRVTDEKGMGLENIEFRSPGESG